ncbi:MAG: RNA-binding cell elongation regulator Jag/EloR [Dehalococcoidia bacterium]
MESVEISAKTEEEAVDLALADLGLSRSEVEIVVVKRRRTGLFGFGAEEVRVRVTQLGQLPEDRAGMIAMAKEVLEGLLVLMDVPATVNLEERRVGSEEFESFDIRGEDLGILIGRRGETLTALQYVTNLVVSRKVKARVGVLVDVEGYRQRRYESLQTLAQRSADRVKETGRTITLEPMPPAERRIIHLELQDHADVTTESVGLGDERKVTVVLKGSDGGRAA